ncbi:hypothetical protein [Mycobacterium seoulense]|uniref:Uncharacterized protein n=1 Tax=Mycobacterium seoulense TaxID=386911 RepID=A0A7I7P0C2_9MYCO|nr:hypothetical protein [Mycobacterium seoulense]MCV7436532.1 hypothetical protein [Mycobacterium seoulense]BBY01512.1 hypothetical protein MSEO_20110 [Mycobacterium seoulense]
MIGLTGGIPLFVDTEETLVAHDPNIGATSANSVRAINGVLRITDKYGAETLDRTLTVAEKAWGYTAATWDGMLLGGIGKFLGRHGALVDNDDELAKKTAKARHAEAWRGKVHSISSAGGTQHSGTGGWAMTCYNLLVQQWSKHRRSEAIKIVL